MPEQDLPDVELLNAAFRDFIPHNKALGLELVRVNAEPSWAEMVMPWNDQLIGPAQGRPIRFVEAL